MIKVYFDGAAWLWKKAGYGYLVKKGEQWLTQDYGLVPCEPNKATCNIAEHYALNRALTWLKENGHTEDKIEIFGDSKMVISQIFRGWKCRDNNLPYYIYFAENKELIKEFENAKGRLLPREKNEEADALSKLGLREE